MNHAEQILKCAERSWESTERSEVVLIVTIGNWLGLRNLAERSVDSAERSEERALKVAAFERVNFVERDGLICSERSATSDESSTISCERSTISLERSAHKGTIAECGMWSS